MAAYLFLMIFLFVYFIIFPFMMNNPPQKVCSFWEKKTHTPSYPKFLGFLLAFSMVLFNVIYFSCYSHGIGIVLSSILMFCLFNQKAYMYLFMQLRNNASKTVCFALSAFFLSLFNITFPVAVIMGLVILFTCLMPKHEARQDDGIVALESVTSQLSKVSELHVTTSNEQTDFVIVQEEHDKPGKRKNHDSDKSSRSRRPNRHSNGSNYKTFGKVRHPHFESKRNLGHSLMSDIRTNRNHG